MKRKLNKCRNARHAMFAFFLRRIAQSRQFVASPQHYIDAHLSYCVCVGMLLGFGIASRRQFASLKNVRVSTRLFSSTATKTRDVVVIGGGMVGAMLAAGLGKIGLQVTLVEGMMPTGLSSMLPITTPDLRVSALNRSSTLLLDAVGAWPLIKSAAATPYTRMEVWDNSSNLLSFDDGGAPLGHIVENRITVGALYDIMKSHQVETIHGEVVSIKKEDHPWPYVLLKDGTKLQGRLVVGADGGRSVARTYISPSVVGWSYSQNAVVAAIRHPEGIHNSTAWQHYLPGGPVALLPLHDNYSSIVWSTAPSHADYLLALDEQAFMKELRNALALPNNSGKFMPPLEGIVGKRGAFPLKFEHALQYTKDRVALVGDAAHTVHPMAGQGVNLGFADTLALLSSITSAIQTGSDIGSDRVLEEYERMRKNENHGVLLGVDMIKKVYSMPWPFDKVVGLGAGVINHFPPIKHTLMKIAFGSYSEADVKKSLGLA